MSVVTKETAGSGWAGRRLFDSLWGQYGRFLHVDHRVPLETLGLYRILFALYLLAMNPLPDLRWIADYPNVFHDPAPGPMALWSGFPASPVLWALELAMVAAVCALAIGWRTVWASIAVAATGLAADSVYLSFGKIDHTAVVWFTPLLLAVSGWGAFWSSDRLAFDRGVNRRGSGVTGNLALDTGEEALDRPRSPGWPIAAVAVMLALAFGSAALPKLALGWLSLDSSASRGYFDQLYVGLGRDDLLANAFVDVEFGPLWELFDWGTVGLELALVVAILWPIALRWTLFVAWVFHLATVLIMNIPFFGPTPIYALFFVALIRPDSASRVGGWLVDNRRWTAGALLPLAAASMFGSGLYRLALVETVGLRLLVAEMLYFAVGMVVLIALVIRSRWFTRVY